MPFKNIEDRQEWGKSYYKNNKPKMVEYNRNYRLINKEKLSNQKKEYYRRNKDKIAQRGLLYKYKITSDDYSNMLNKQDGKCAICNRIEKSITKNKKIKPLGVDHDHKTGKIRGLLCTNCNVGLGYFEDDPDILIKAIKYLKGDI